jgi:hypothetical protein
MLFELGALVLLEQIQLGTPLEEPLLAAHDQEDLDLMAKEEAKVKAERLAEEERQERERQWREVRLCFFSFSLCTSSTLSLTERARQTSL